MSDNPTEGWSLEARLRFEAEAMRLAPSGQATPGTFHLGNWQDKPHRVLYDACRLMEEAADALSKVEVPNSPPHDTDTLVAELLERARVEENNLPNHAGQKTVDALRKAVQAIESLKTCEKLCQQLTLFAHGHKDHAETGLDKALIVLREVQEACLFVDDDDRGTICVTSDPHIDSELFDRICDVLRKYQLSKCPDCGSYNPLLYPSAQAYGVEPTCQHFFHRPVNHELR